jgi:hypothetical protein
MKRLTRPEMKAPAFLADIYYDLRERRLLPLLALIVVATAAVPFLLGDSEEEAPSPVASAVANASQLAQPDPSKLVVVEAKPGLRDYKKRLARNTKKDPFRQKFTSPMLKGARLDTESKTSTTTSTTSTGTTSGSGTGPSSGAPPPSAPKPDGKPDGRPDLVFYAFAINVRITKAVAGKKGGKKQEPIVKKRVLPQTPLPGKKTPVVTYMGPATKDEKATGKALMLVSNEVQSVFGETTCVTGKGACQLIEVEPGFPVTFVYGENEVRFTINVLKLGLVVTGRADLDQEPPRDSQSFSK